MARKKSVSPSVEEFTRPIRRSIRLQSKDKDADKEPSPRASPDHVDTWADTVAINDKPSVALKSGLHGQTTLPVPDAPITDAVCTSDISGLWGLLPEELIETVLKLCTTQQLGMLQSTCTYFHSSRLIERIAKQRLKAVPRARGLKPYKKEHESHLALLHFVNCQSAAAAQATAVACGAHHTAALLIRRDQCMDSESNSVSGSAGSGCSAKDMRHCLFTFGRGFHGQLGTTQFSDEKLPTRVSLGFRPCQENGDLEEETMPAVVACGAHHTTSISRRGELFAWGLGSHGELGHGRWTPVEVPTPQQCLLPQVRIVSIACGASHTLAIGETGSLWSCGKNSRGQLGIGNQIESLRLQLVQNLTHNARIVSAASGAEHSMALSSDGSLYTWGDSKRGQLGHMQLHHVATVNGLDNALLTLPLRISRLDPSTLSPENRVTAIAAGSHHSMALTVGGSILAFGANDCGNLGLGDFVDRWKPTKVSIAADEEEGQCIRAVQLACGAAHSVALISNQGCLEVRTTGANSWGQLGQGTQDRQPQNYFKPTSSLPKVVAVQAGDEHSAAITATGDLYVWGRGDSGQLGLGDARARSKPTLMKDYIVVHPDKTLRRSRRNQPFVRPMTAEHKRQRMQEPLHFL
mmetsp:Transcript_26924/g.58797  ORF Transcript_26924/g.58797 Transcript_26924/m.58797 type:complete len:634 (+) Transcript_26924:184-2085(+)